MGITLEMPVVRGIIDRRILINYRVDPDVLQNILPGPFRVKRVRGYGIAGICLIRLKQIRPRYAPPWLGLTSENAAHRIAVEWEQDGQTREGVYIPRRDTSSPLAMLAGGWIFPGEHHPAYFDVREDGERYRIALRSRDGVTRLAIDVRRTTRFPLDSLFGSLDEVSDFFARGSLGYSATRRTGLYEGLELHTEAWKVEPLAVASVRSGFFEDTARFPAGSVTFDNALLMRGIPHEWRAHEPLS